MSPKASTTKINKKQWYAATLIVRVRIEDHLGPHVCFDQVRLIQARSAEKAYKKAYKVGKAQDTCHLNDDGKMVYREFVGLQDLNVIDGSLVDGVLIKSREFSHGMPQVLVRMQDEMSAFGKPLESSWHGMDQAVLVHDNE